MGGHKAPMPYQPKNSAAVDQGLAANIAMNNAHTSALYDYSKPLYESAYNTAANNPGNAIATQGALDASVAGGAAGRDMLSRGYTMAGLEPSIIESAWDPHSSTLNWDLGQVGGAADVYAAQTGTNGSPFGAGQHADAISSFLRDWGMQTQERQGIGVDQLTKLDTGANAAMGQGLSTMTNASLLPQAEANDQNNQRIAALNALVTGLGGITSSSNQTAASADNYLNTGVNAANAGANVTKANNATTEAMWGALGQAAGLAASFIPHSDRRLKENIVKVGEMANGIGIYTYNFIGQSHTEMGVIAQEAMLTRPDAVTMGDDGYYHVEYGKLI